MNTVRLITALTTTAFVTLMVTGYPFCSIRKVAFWGDRRGSLLNFRKGRRNQFFSEMIIVSLLYAFISGALIALVEHCPRKSKRSALRWLLVGGNCMALLITVVKVKIGYHSLDFIFKKWK